MSVRPFRNFVWDIIFGGATNPEKISSREDPISVIAENFGAAYTQAKQLTPPSGWLLVGIRISQGIRTQSEVEEIERTQPAAPVE